MPLSALARTDERAILKGSAFPLDQEDQLAIGHVLVPADATQGSRDSRRTRLPLSSVVRGYVMETDCHPCDG
jgi:hypothetical protein